jgi:hypothetical protein
MHLRSLVPQKASFGQFFSQAGNRLYNEGKHAYDGNNCAEPPPPLVQCPNPIAVESLNNERNRRVEERTIYRGEMAVAKPVHIAEPCHKPKVYI